MDKPISPGTQGKGSGRLARIALILSGGGLALAVLAAVGTGQGSFGFKIGLLLLVLGFLASVIGGVIAIIALVAGGRRGLAAARAPIIALAIALVFGGYVIGQVQAAMQVPPIHDVTTDLADVPAFTTLPVRADNLADIPSRGDAALAALPPDARWRAIHRQAYGDLKTLHLPLDTAKAMDRATRLVQARGWAIAKVDAATGTIEATDTSLFFRFKDDVVVRVRPDRSPAGGAIVDMRSISRVGQSDIGVNAKRIRAFLADLQRG